MRSTRHNSTLRDKVLAAAADGIPLTIADEVPAQPLKKNKIDARVIREALTGEHRPLSYRGLLLRGFYIEGDLDLSFAQWSGQLGLINCRINGKVVLSHVRVDGLLAFDGSVVRSVSAQGATINGSLRMRNGFIADEGLYGIGMRVTDSLDLRHSHFTAPIDIPTRMAVELFRANLGDVFFVSAKFDGGVYATAITVARNVRIQGSSFVSRESLGWQVSGPDFKGALTLAGSQVGGSLYVSTRTTRGNFSASGPVSFRSMSCNQFFIHREILDFDVNIEDTKYSVLRGISPADLLKWLRQHTKFSPQAYVQLATYCRAIGDLDMQKKVLIRLEQTRTGTMPSRSVGRALRRLQGVLVGYGYRAARALPWLLVAATMASILIHFHGQFLISKPGSGIAWPRTGNTISWSDSISYTIDSFLPFASLGVTANLYAQAATGWQWLWFTIFLLLKFGSWALAALALASFTNAAKKTQ